jgi:hypothetical protein
LLSHYAAGNAGAGKRRETRNGRSRAAVPRQGRIPEQAVVITVPTVIGSYCGKVTTGAPPEPARQVTASRPGTQGRGGREGGASGAVRGMRTRRTGTGPCPGIDAGGRPPLGIYARQALAGHLAAALAGHLQTGTEAGPRIARTRAWPRHIFTRAVHYREFMNSRPGAHGGTGASAGVGGEGLGRRESLAPFVINDGGMRRARPAGPPDPPPPGWVSFSCR